ncbi:MAG: hypothetical protein WBM41_13265 [Arenicellales bacterium]|jgi:hypothetical protein
MQWALLAVIIVGLFMISGRYPKLAFSALGVIIFGTAAVVLLTTDEATLKRQKVAAENVEVVNTTVVPAYAGSYRISGRLSNAHDSAELKGITLNVVMMECMGANRTECQIVGQASERINLRVPAGQARDFYTTVYFGEPTISGSVQWQFEVTETRS